MEVDLQEEAVLLVEVGGRQVEALAEEVKLVVTDLRILEEATVALEAIQLEVVAVAEAYQEAVVEEEVTAAPELFHQISAIVVVGETIVALVSILQGVAAELQVEVINLLYRHIQSRELLFVEMVLQRILETMRVRQLLC